MQVAVFDTYVLKPEGSTLHFDIIVPKEISLEQVLEFGRLYLATVAPGGQISARECQFCHIEEPTPEMIGGILREGYFILGFEDIPAELPAEPTRRQMIEHLRARSEAHRFANFRGVQEEELREMIRRL